jgi:hypothetical protein|tara:strand:- start:899 stop:2746 length:1848 start_codon:yes stop_codon:yes gene_type:complete
MVNKIAGRIPAIDVLEESSPPDLDEILSLQHNTESYFAGFHAECEKVDDYYFGRNEIATPEGFDAIHTSQAASIINVATDHVDVNNAAIDVPLSSPRGKARAEKLKKFYHGVWLNIRSPVKQTAAKHAFAYGIGWFKTTWDADRWPNSPKMSDYKDLQEYKDALEDFMEQRNIKFPIIAENINPRRLVWDTSRIGPRWAIESYDMACADVKQMYPEWTDETEMTELAQWSEYWDEKWYVFIANNEVVASGEHGYGFFPYVAVQPARSLDWDDRPPHERYRGLYSGIYDLLDEHARLTTAYSAIIRNTAWRTLDFIGPEHLAEKARDNYEIFSGMNVVPAGVEIRPSPMVQVPPDLLQELSIIETQIEQATFPNVIRGARPRGVSSGFGISVLAGMGRLVFQGVADGMAHAIEICNGNFAKLIENKAKGKLTVHARSEIHSFDQTIGPEDVRGYYENIVTLKAEAPEEREREALLAVRLLQAGIISLYEAQRRAGVNNPLEMQVDQAAEALMKSPAVQQVMQKLAAERVDLLGQVAASVGGAMDMATGQNTGNQFLPGQSQLQEPGQAGIQQQRMASKDAVDTQAFPQGMGGMDLMAGMIGGAPGAQRDLPNGESV